MPCRRMYYWLIPLRRHARTSLRATSCLIWKEAPGNRDPRCCSCRRRNEFADPCGGQSPPHPSLNEKASIHILTRLHRSLLINFLSSLTSYQFTWRWEPCDGMGTMFLDRSFVCGREHMRATECLEYTNKNSLLGSHSLRSFLRSFNEGTKVN